MYCIKCNCHREGKFCTKCGRQLISSQKEWNNWSSRYKDYSKKQLEDMLLHRGEYQEDAIVAAQYLYDNYEESEKEDEEEPQSGDRIWYYAVNGERKGPVTEERLIQLLYSESIDSSTVVWRQGFKDWVNMMQAGINILSKEKTTPPPLAANQVNNRFIIFLLFVPIMSTLFQFVIAGIFQINVSRLWWVGYGMNCICCTIDYYNVKKAGYNANKLMWPFLFLVPLYIYKRMVMVKGHKWLFTCMWTTVFIVDLLIPDVFWIKTIGISNPEVIQVVQDGEFYDYPNKTVGEIFENSLEDCEWRTYLGKNRMVLVQVTGNVEGKVADVIFEIGTDNSFEVWHMSIGGTQYSQSQINSVIEYFYEK